MDGVGGNSRLSSPHSLRGREFSVLIASGQATLSRRQWGEPGWGSQDLATRQWEVRFIYLKKKKINKIILKKSDLWGNMNHWLHSVV